MAGAIAKTRAAAILNLSMKILAAAIAALGLSLTVQTTSAGSPPPPIWEGTLFNPKALVTVGVNTPAGVKIGKRPLYLKCDLRFEFAADSEIKARRACEYGTTDRGALTSFIQDATYVVESTGQDSDKKILRARALDRTDLLNRPATLAEIDGVGWTSHITLTLMDNMLVYEEADVGTATLTPAP